MDDTRWSNMIICPAEVGLNNWWRHLLFIAADFITRDRKQASAKSFKWTLMTEFHALSLVFRLLCVSSVTLKCLLFLCLLFFMLLPGQVSLVKQVLISRWGAKVTLNVLTQTSFGKKWLCYSVIMFFLLLGMAVVSHFFLLWAIFLLVMNIIFTDHHVSPLWWLEAECLPRSQKREKKVNSVRVILWKVVTIITILF